MTDKDLKRLSRAEILELFLEQCKRNETLEKELAEVKAQLADREIKIANSGSLAEASLALTEIFEEAQKAAELYLANVKGEAGRPAVARKKEEPVIATPEEVAEEEVAAEEMPVEIEEPIEMENLIEEPAEVKETPASEEVAEEAPSELEMLLAKAVAEVKMETKTTQETKTTKTGRKIKKPQIVMIKREHRNNK